MTTGIGLMNRFSEMSLEQKAIISEAFKPFQDMAEEMRKTLKPTLDAMKLLSSRECATSLRKRRSHRNYCEVRAIKVQDTDIQELVSNLESQWSEWTTEELEPPNEVEASSLRCNGPPSYLVYEASHSLTNRLNGSQDKETVTV